jgi:hypothetical protein
MPLGSIISCRLTEEEAKSFSRIASLMGKSESELVRWFIQQAINAERVIMDEIKEKGMVMPPEVFLAKMDGHLTDWFRKAFFSTNWVSKPEEIQAVGLKLLELARVFRESLHGGNAGVGT